jgi:hypothetical protein
MRQHPLNRLRQRLSLLPHLPQKTKTKEETVIWLSTAKHADYAHIPKQLLQ